MLEGLLFILKGILVGFVIAAPIGPAGALCIHRTLNKGRVAGIITSLGAASVDVLYGIIAAYGLTFISDFFFQMQDWLRPFAALFLFVMGIIIFLSKPKTVKTPLTFSNSLGDFSSVFFINLANPLTIIGFVALFAGLGIGSKHYNFSLATCLIIGIIIGSILCWLILVEIIHLFRKQISINLLKWINRAAGILIAAFGIAALFSINLG